MRSSAGFNFKSYALGRRARPRLRTATVSFPSTEHEAVSTALTAIRMNHLDSTALDKVRNASATRNTADGEIVSENPRRKTAGWVLSIRLRIDNSAAKPR
jgi:hypothetical protein